MRQPTAGQSVAEVNAGSQRKVNTVFAGFFAWGKKSEDVRKQKLVYLQSVLSLRVDFFLPHYIFTCSLLRLSALLESRRLHRDRHIKPTPAVGCLA